MSLLSVKNMEYLQVGLIVLFIISGIITIPFGYDAKGTLDSYAPLLGPWFLSIPTTMIWSGVLVVVIGIYGLVSIQTKKRLMTQTFAYLMLVVFFLELILGIRSSQHNTDSRLNVQFAMRDSMVEYSYNFSELLAHIWDDIQLQYQCCGIFSAKDWLDITNSIPKSCCSINPGSVRPGECNIGSSNLYTLGCLDSFTEFIQSIFYNLTAANFSIGAFQGIDMLLFILAVFGGSYFARNRNGSQNSLLARMI